MFTQGGKAQWHECLRQQMKEMKEEDRDVLNTKSLHALLLTTFEHRHLE